jgi:photosystem II stability/assembly factor-like uncharacterized protein
MKRILAIIFSFCLVFVFSACSLSNNPTSNTPVPSVSQQTGSFLKSSDGGKNWENKTKIDDTKNLGAVNILSMAVDPKDSNIIYVGTENDGLLVTRNGAENWEKLVFPLTKIYGLAIDKNNDQTIYASGILNSRPKIYKSLNGGTDWTEIYTEPGSNTVISSLEISKKDPNVLYCGTSEGTILKTVDGGKNWKNLTKANGPIIGISFDSAKDNAVYFGVFQESVLRTLDGGGKIDDLGKLNFGKLTDGAFLSLGAYSIAADPVTSGVLYVGTDSGMFKSSNFGDKWEEVNIIESSKKFPIRAIAISPQNSNEIVYGSSGVIYHSLDKGLTWLTFQLNTSNAVQVMRYDQNNPSVVYAGMRKI